MAASQPQTEPVPLDDEEEPPRVAQGVPSRMGVWEMVRETWASRPIIPRLGIRVTVKGYSSTRLGRSWLVARPGMSVFGMGLPFGGVLGTPSQGLPYLVFFLTGTHAWMTFDRLALWMVRSFNVYRRV